MDCDESDHLDYAGEVDEKTHDKLIENVLSLNKNQHVKKPVRTEPTLQVSEFNLVKSITGEKGSIDLHELTKVLKNHKVGTKINDTSKKATNTLPKPLEKPQADRIRRTIAYEKSRLKLDKWEPVVTANRAAAHITFPLDHNSKIELKEAKQLTQTWRSKSELQKELEKIDPPEVEVYNIEPNEEKTKMTMKQMLEHRKDMAKLRALQSYKEAKARRQNKIKSKKYHRIERRKKIKQQLKEFEVLQKTNPEEALKKLEDIDRIRAEERFSLRHRSTGQWAKSKQIRAKYDKESRQVLAQQLALSRELTQKVKAANEDSDDQDEDDANMEEDETVHQTADPNNPWVSGIKPEQEVEQFMSSYRKFWNEKNKLSEIVEESTEENVVESELELESDEDQGDQEHDDDFNAVLEDEECIEDKKGKKKHNHIEVTKDNCKAVSQNKECIKVKKGKKKQNSIENSNDVCEVVLQNEECIKDNKEKKKLKGTENSTDVSKIVSQNKKKRKIIKNSNDVCKALLQNEEPIKDKKGKKKRTGTENSTNVSKILPQNKKKRKSTENSNIVCKVVPQNEECIHDKKGKKKRKGAENSSDVNKIMPQNKKKQKIIENSNVVSKIVPHNESIKNKKSKKKNKSIESSTTTSNWKVSEMDIEGMFQKLEGKLEHKAKKKAKYLKNKMSKESEPDKSGDVKTSFKKDGKKKRIDLSLPLQRKKAIIDEELIEVSGNADKVSEYSSKSESGGNNGISMLLEEAKRKENHVGNDGDIKSDNKKPVQVTELDSTVPDALVGNFEDDDEQEENNQIANLMDAFEDDDAITDFSKEKKEEIEKNLPKDIDLSLPGWGSWGGAGIKVSKRRKRRFIIRMPKKVPRKDDNKASLIINEKAQSKIKDLMVSEVPFPFTSVKDFESNLRAPIGRTFVPEIAYNRLIRPAVTTKIGTIIEPMSKDILFNKT